VHVGERALGAGAHLPLHPVLGVLVSEALDVVEDEPGHGDEQEGYKGAGDEDDRGAVLDGDGSCRVLHALVPALAQGVQHLVERA